MNKKLLITGGAGFIGFHTVKFLLERGDDVVGIDNLNDYYDVKKNIVAGLVEHGYTLHKEYEVAKVPNIVDISYGRGVGYSLTEHDMGATIHDISATKIRAQLRAEGKL